MKRYISGDFLKRTPKEKLIDKIEQLLSNTDFDDNVYMDLKRLKTTTLKLLAADLSWLNQSTT